MHGREYEEANLGCVGNAAVKFALAADLRLMRTIRMMMCMVCCVGWVCGFEVWG